MLPMLAFVLAQANGPDFTQYTPLQAWMLIVAFLSPVVIQLIIRAIGSGLPSWAAPVVAFVWSFLVVLVEYLLTVGREGLFNGAQFVSNLLIIFALTIPFYYGFWKPTGVTEGIQGSAPRSKEEALTGIRQPTRHDSGD